VNSSPALPNSIAWFIDLSPPTASLVSLQHPLGEFIDVVSTPPMPLLKKSCRYNECQARRILVFK
jgi:hypothetical protein